MHSLAAWRIHRLYINAATPASRRGGVAWWRNDRALDLRSRGRGFDSRVGAQLRNDRGQVAHTRLPRRRQSSLLYGVVKPGIFTFTARRAPPLFSTQSESVGFVVVKYWNDRQGHYAPSILGNSELGEMYDGGIVDAWVRVTSTVCDFVCICVRVCAACPRSAQQRKLSTQKLVGM